MPNAKKMMYGKILNDFLIELSEYNESRKLSARPEHLLKQNKELSMLDRYLILQKLTKDGYANESSKDEYRITFLGKMFIKDNGYVGLSKKKRNERLEKLIWLIAGASLTLFITITVKFANKYLENKTPKVKQCECQLK